MGARRWRRPSTYPRRTCEPPIAAAAASGEACRRTPSDGGAAAPLEVPMNDTDHDCSRALRALADGDYAGWPGLTDTCTTAALGPAPGGDRSGDLGGSPTRYRVHAPSPGAPHGLYVYDVAERVVLVSTHGARPVRPLSGQLGEPDARLPSRMPGFKTIWLRAARGLALHLDDVAADVVDGGGEAGAAPARSRGSTPSRRCRSTRSAARGWRRSASTARACAERRARQDVRSPARLAGWYARRRVAPSPRVDRAGQPRPGMRTSARQDPGHDAQRDDRRTG